MVKNPPANAGDIRDAGLNPGSGRFPGVGKIPYRTAAPSLLCSHCCVSSCWKVPSSPQKRPGRGLTTRLIHMQLLPEFSIGSETPGQRKKASWSHQGSWRVRRTWDWLGSHLPVPHPQHDLCHPLRRVSSELLRADRRSVWLTAIALALTASPTVGIQ